MYVHGLPSEMKKGDVMTDIVIPHYENEFFDFHKMTDGELSNQLKAAQFKALKASFPNHPEAKKWQRTYEMYLDSIWNGLHGLQGNVLNFRALDDDLRLVALDIKKNSKRVGASSPHGVELYDREHVGIGTDPIIQILKASDCPDPKQRNFNTSTHTYIDANSSAAYAIYDACISKVMNQGGLLWKETLNNYLEKSSHHCLYEFVDDLQGSQLRPTTSWKIGAHKQSLGVVSRISGLSRDNMTEWFRLGIMRRNAVKGVGALPPAQTIDTIFSDPTATIAAVQSQTTDGIGIIPAAAFIIWACVGAITAIAGLVQAINKQEPTALDRLGQIGTTMFSAEGGDNATKTGTGTGTGNGLPTGTTGNGLPTGTTGNGLPPLEPEKTWLEKNGLLVGAGVIGLGLMLTSGEKK